MIHRWELDPGHQISIEDRGSQTIVTVLYSGSGQQQQTSNSFTTGEWLSPPEMTIDPTGCSVKIIATNGESLIRIQGNRIQMQSNDGSKTSSSSSYSSSSSSFRSGIEPLPPLQMGNMQMSMQPMRMQMGDMELNMGTPVNANKFCTQCGTAVKNADRFCANCGHKLGD